MRATTGSIDVHVLQLFTAAILAFGTFQMAAAARVPQPFWIVAHRLNDEVDIATALRRRANAVEFDVVADGQSFTVRHPTEEDAYVPTLSAYLAAAMRERQRVTLMYVDYKGPDFSAAACSRLIAELRAAKVPSSGMRTVVTVKTLETSSFFDNFPQEAWIAPHFYDNVSPDAVLKFFESAGIRRGWYGGGVRDVLSQSDVKANLRTAMAHRDAGSPIKGVLFWMSDKRAPVRDYLRLGVNAILTIRKTSPRCSLKANSQARTE